MALNAQVAPTITWATPAPITYGTPLSATQLDATANTAGTFAYTPAKGAVLGAGSQTLSVTFTPTNTSAYTTATKTVTLVVNQKTPTITWSNPAAITYGIPLSLTQLDASTGPAGTFVYTPAKGTVLGAGSHTLSVSFTPTDTTDYTTATKTVTLVVDKKTPTITWGNPAAITYGTPLSLTQLDAKTGPAGTFVYTPAKGTVLGAGSHTLSVTFTPTDTTDYNTATKTATLVVSKKVPTITWGNPAAITYGTALSTKQLDATTGPAGTFTYTPAAGAVLAAGTQTLSLTFAPTDTADYTSATKTVSLTVNKAPLKVTVNNATRAYGAANPTFTGTITGLVNGNTVTVSYSTTATASSPVTATYPITAAVSGAAAANYTTTVVNGVLTITKASLTVTANPQTMVFGGALPAFTATITGFLNGDPSSVVTGQPSFTSTANSSSGAGSYTITPAIGTLAATNYGFAFANGTLTITPATLTIDVNNATRIYGAPNPTFTGTITGVVNGDSPTVTYSTTATTTSAIGTYPITASISGTYSTDYSLVTEQGTLTVAAAVSGQIDLNNGFCSGVVPPTITVSINTTPVQTTTTNAAGQYAFQSVPAGTYTITPSISGPEAEFYPATLTGVTVSNTTPAVGESMDASIGYTVSGAISYSGSGTGQTYITLVPVSCGLEGYPQTSITKAALTSGGTYQIRGVPPGKYTLAAWMDTIGQGAPNATDPLGTASVTVSNANVTGADATMVTPTLSAPTTSPTLKSISPANLGAVVSIDSTSVENSIAFEEFTSYQVEWSTTLTGFSTSNSAKFQAVGTRTKFLILNNSVKGLSGSFTNGDAYYFRVAGSTSAGTGPWSYWAGSDVTCSTTSCALPVTVGAPSGTGYNAVTGTVTIPSSVKPTGPLYVGFNDEKGNIAYYTVIANPSNSTPNTYSVNVPDGLDYFFFAILDQNNDGLIDLGDLTNIYQAETIAPIAISGPLSGEDLTLSSANGQAAVIFAIDEYTLPMNGVPTTSTDSELLLDVSEGLKLPVALTLTGGPNVISPVDMGSLCQDCGSEFGYYVRLATVLPNIGNTYNFTVTYSDGTTQSLTAEVTSAIGSGKAITALAPTYNTASPSTTPTFTWTYPANAGNYTYYFYLEPSTGGTIWEIPADPSTSIGFTSTQIPMPGGLVFGTDPTNPANVPTQSSLSSNTVYYYYVETRDSTNNYVEVETYFTPQ